MTITLAHPLSTFAEIYGGLLEIAEGTYEILSVSEDRLTIEVRPR